jgi:hypothetical protein
MIGRNYSKAILGEKIYIKKIGIYSPMIEKCKGKRYDAIRTPYLSQIASQGCEGI